MVSVREVRRPPLSSLPFMEFLRRLKGYHKSDAERLRHVDRSDAAPERVSSLSGRRMRARFAAREGAQRLRRGYGCHSEERDGDFSRDLRGGSAVRGCADSGTDGARRDLWRDFFEIECGRSGDFSQRYWVFRWGTSG